MNKCFILGLLVLFASACVHEYPVTDHSFEFSGVVVYDQDADQHRLTLTCSKPSGASEYNVAFLLDNESIITLTDINGRTYQEFLKVSCAETSTHTFQISEVPVGTHLLQLTISSDEFNQSIGIPYEVTRQKYDIHAEVSTVGATNSTLMMSLADGDTKYTYTIAVSLDGEELFSEEIDFSLTPIASLDLPVTIRPEAHTLKLEVNDGMTNKEYAVNFTEPVRHPILPITLVHDEESGYHVAEIGPNPYSILVSISASLQIQGKSSYYPSDNEDAYFWGHPYYKYLTETKSVNIHDSEGNKTVEIIERDAIAEKITSKWEVSYIWGFSTDERGDFNSYIIGTQPAFYQINTENFTIDFSAEALPGVALNITNNIGKLTLNGQQSTSGTTKLPL